MLVLMLAQIACASGWQTMRPTNPQSLPPDREVRVWTSDTAAQWRSVRIRRDSISGIPVAQPLDCDSCRVTLSRHQVDSLQTATSGTNAAGTAIVIGIGVAAAGFIICVIQGGCNLRPYD